MTRPAARSGPYRDGRVHVLAEMCSTCVFRPGNLMSLDSGRLRGLVNDNLRADSALTCHSTLYRGDDVGEAVCRGFYDRHSTTPLRLAALMDVIVFDDPPEKDR